MFLSMYRELIEGIFIYNQHSCGSKKGRKKLIGCINFNLISKHKCVPQKLKGCKAISRLVVLIITGLHDVDLYDQNLYLKQTNKILSSVLGR